MLACISLRRIPLVPTREVRKIRKMRLSNGSLMRVATSVLVAALALLGCFSLPIEEDTAQQGTEKFELKMAAGPIGERLLVSNHSTEPWTNIVMVINVQPDGGGGYKLTLSKFAARATLHFAMRAFRNSEGERFDVKNDWMKTLNVGADTATGKGHWRSKYRKKQTKVV